MLVIMNENPDMKPKPRKRLRSPGYPSIPLESAVEKAIQLWERENRHSVPIASASHAWDYQEGSSQTFSTVAALLKFGLLENTGTGKSREIKLTKEAIDIIVLADNEPERKKLLADTAIAPQIHSDLWNHFEGSLPSDVTIKSYLIREKNFNPKFVDGFIDEYKESLEFGGLLGNDSNDAEDAVEDEDSGSDSEKQHQLKTRERFQNKGNKNMLAEYQIPLGSNEAHLTFTGDDLVPEDFDALIDYVQLFKLQFERKKAQPKQNEGAGRISRHVLLEEDE